jgi:GTP-binding protein HflX
VFNQIDKPQAREMFALPDHSLLSENTVFMSAKTGEGVEDLLAGLQKLLHAGKSRATFVIPNARAGEMNRLYAEGAAIESIDYGAEAITVVAVVDDKLRGRLRAYDTCPPQASEDD